MSLLLEVLKGRKRERVWVCGLKGRCHGFFFFFFLPLLLKINSILERNISWSVVAQKQKCENLKNVSLIFFKFQSIPTYYVPSLRADVSSFRCCTRIRVTNNMGFKKTPNSLDISALTGLEIATNTVAFTT